MIRFLLTLALALIHEHHVLAQGMDLGPESVAVPGRLKVRLVNGVEVETGLARFPVLARIAGTPLAMRLQKSIAAGSQEGIPTDVVVEGPSAFSEEARRPPPKFLGRLFHKVHIWTKWQLAGDKRDKWRLRGPPRHLPHPLLTSTEILALLETPGPDGRPLLLPGDLLVSGIGGIATHVSAYVGPDPGTGSPRIVHSMATPKTQQSYPMLVVNVLETLLITRGRIGVFEEGLGEFFDRFQRDTWFVVRDPRMTDAMRVRGIARVRTLIGRGYDYDVNQSNDSLYCTEIYAEMLRGAYEGTGLALPWVGTTAVTRIALEDFPIMLDNILASPDLDVTGANATGWKHLEHVVRTHVVGAIQTAD